MAFSFNTRSDTRGSESLEDRDDSEETNIRGERDKIAKLTE